MTEKIEKPKQQEKAKQPEKPRVTEKAREKEAVKKPNAITRWYRETVGELRKVTWPTPKDARRLTGIVLLVMFATSALLGLLDFLFSHIVALVLA